MIQELLPDHLLKEARAAGDKGKGASKQWPFAWGKKKGEQAQEPLPTPDTEVLKVNYCTHLCIHEIVGCSACTGLAPPVPVLILHHCLWQKVCNRTGCAS